MKDFKEKRSQRQLPYTSISSLPGRLGKSSAEHGYHGFFGTIYFAVKMLWVFYLNLLAMFMPYSGPRVILHRMRGVKIGKNVMIGFNVTLDNVYPDYISIGNGVSLAGNNLVITHSKPLEYHQELFKSYVAPVVIEDNAWITVGVTILPGVTIGEGSVIAAGSVVTDDIPANCLAAGNPAKVIKKLDIKPRKS